MRTVRRLRLRFLSSSARFPQPYGFHIAERHYPYSWPNRSCVRPGIKTQYQSKFTRNTKVNLLCFYGWPGRHCPAVLNPFLDRSLRCSLYYIFIFDCCQPLVLGLHLATIFLFWDLNSSRFWARACSHSAWVLNLACSPCSGTGPSTLKLNTQINVRLISDS